MPISAYSAVRDDNASIPPGDIRSKVPDNQQILNSIRQVMADIKAWSTGAAAGDMQELGVWTPTLTFATPGNLVVAYTTRVGTYSRIGKEVTLRWSILTSTFTHTTASGSMRITGSPFTANADLNYYGVLSWQVLNLGGLGHTFVIPRLPASSNIIDFIASGNNVSVSAITNASAPTGSTMILAGALTLIVP